MDAREFQFILDRRKDTDPFKLNAIYSIAKKIRQLKQDADGEESIEKCQWQEKLKKAMGESTLSDSLKLASNLNSDDVFPDSTFLNLICRYYKQRLRARDGRVFIHPLYRWSNKQGYEKTNNFDDDNQLLKYCNHKTRQKKYQMLYDVAGVFQVKPQYLAEKIGSEDDEGIHNWLKKFRGMTKLCEDAAKAQKDERGTLGHKLAMAGPKTPLGKLKAKAKEMSKCVADTLFGNADDVRGHKFDSVFSFAQLNNIAFKDRNGNSNTCPVCSLENSFRMDNIVTDKKEHHAKAQRLPAIPTRLIDGAVMRMVRILTKRIAEDNWDAIDGYLKDNARVRIPIITEMNQFEFEPSLRKLKSKPTKEITKFDSKRERIQKAGKGICPYTGQTVGNKGEVDHIIPRQSRWGTLNDETNLIYASNPGNQHKSNTCLTLANLHPNYKNTLFGKKTDEEIARWIEETIWDADTKSFRFGKYRNFINLEEHEQKAFRHALFLGPDNPICKEVINEISNIRKTLVNGTQRFFAEELANEFYKRAMKQNKQDLLEFDYFGVEAFDNPTGLDIKFLRAEYEFLYENELEKYKKQEGKSQTPYSHLIDAHLAFVIAASEHKKDGSLQLDIAESRDLRALNRETGALAEENLFTDTWVRPDEFNKSFYSEVDMARRKPCTGFTQHRSFTRANFYADRYVPVLLKRNNDGKIEVRAGFSWENSAPWKISKKDLPHLIQIARLSREVSQDCANDYTHVENLEALYSKLLEEPKLKIQMKNGIIMLHMNRKALHDLWKREHNTLNGRPFGKFFEICYEKLGYRMEKFKIIDEESFLKELNTSKNFCTKVFDDTIELPFKLAWEKFDRDWKEASRNGENFEDFTRRHFMGKHTQHAPHQRARKNFSLPKKSDQGHYLLFRTGWNGDSTYQIIADSDSRSIDNKATIPVELEDSSKGEDLNPWAKTKNMVKLSKDMYSDGTPIDPYCWYLIDLDSCTIGEKQKQALQEAFASIWMRIDDTTRPSYAIKLAKNAQDVDAEKLLYYPLCKPKMSVGEMKKWWDSNILSKIAGDIFLYKGSGYTKVQNEAFKNSKKNTYILA